MKVINKNIGTYMLAHYCPKCGEEVFNNHKVVYDRERNCGIGKCDNCGIELEFPNFSEIMELLGV